MLLPANRRVIDVAAPLRLAGRDGELRVLREHLAAAGAGDGRLVLISGAAGIGKTTLAELVSQEAADQGALVRVGRCYDLAETPPYGPWLEVFAPHQQWEGLPSRPDIFTQPSGVGAPSNQAALFNDVLTFVTAAAMDRVVVFLLDDLHWADPASLDLLRFLARVTMTLPVLLIGTYRSDSTSPSHPLYRLGPILVREARAHRIELRPLADGAVRAIIAERYQLRDLETARLESHVQERAQGNPFFLSELLRTVEEEGALTHADGIWQLGALETLRVPGLLQQVIEGRLARVSDETRSLLVVAAVIGQEIPYALWAAVAALDEDALLDRIGLAAEAALIMETADGVRARFAHALIRAVLYENMLPSRRRRIHRHVADLLIGQAGVDPDAVAHHLRQAGDPRAVVWLTRAGMRAERAFAPLTAAERYEAALALLDADQANGLGDPQARGWLLHSLARARRYVTPLQGIPALDAALDCANRADDPALRGATLRLRGLLRCYTGDVRDGLQDMDVAVTIIRGLGPVDRARFVTQLEGTGFGANDGYGTYIGWLGIIGRCAEALERGEPIVAVLAADPSTPRDPGDLIADSGLALVYAALGMPDAARASFGRYRAANTAIGDHPQVHSAWSYEAMFVHLPYRADHLDERQRIVEEIERARLLAHGAIRYPPNYMLQSFLFIEGKWDEIAAIHRVVRDAGVATQVHLGWAGILAPLAHARGDRDGAWAIVRTVFPTGLTTEPGTHPFLDVLPVIRLAAALALAEGDRATARLWLEMHDRWLAWSGASLGLAEGALGWAIYHAAAEDTGAARAHATRALAYATEPRQPLALLAAHRCLGELETAIGAFASATAHLDAALVLADACTAVYERALTLLASATLRRATGAMDDLTSLLDAARAIATPLGATPLLEQVAALAASAGEHTLAYPDGLTTREVDVLRAIATGKSNKQIADALSISVRTVDRHIANIYLKIGAHNKADATAYAIHHGLTRE